MEEGQPTLVFDEEESKMLDFEICEDSAIFKNSQLDESDHQFFRNQSRIEQVQTQLVQEERGTVARKAVSR